ncbi:Macrophage mannose receptor 1 [Chionoecetes opilio]|uniref:Macrophage mannose receptor 1 n=1 Tax=Chionoecetes opilio TaxID=41210 RepID=A0A8J4XUP9_CHIOP|nr:Macrophage mannose receptor 1 [Chionoecetes opilio]
MAGVGGMGTWLGMKKQENHYLWVDQTPVTLTSWAAGEPSGAKASLLGRRRQKAEECVETLTHSRAGQWNDVACSERRAFVCQAPMEAQTGPSPSPAGPSCAPSDPLYLRTGNHCYHYVLTPRPWQEAEDTCALEGAHLATALTRTEAAAVWVVAMEARLEEAWLGLRHEQEHGAFRWSSGWPLLHAPWSPHTNTSEGEGMCAAVSSSSGQWVARPCLTARPFICHLANDVSGVSERASRGSCPDGRWLDFGGANCYPPSGNRGPGTNARYSCVLEGGDLTSIASAAEMSLVTLTVHDLTQAVWIGLVREANGAHSYHPIIAHRALGKREITDGGERGGNKAMKKRRPVNSIRQRGDRQVKEMRGLSGEGDGRDK